MAQREEVRPDRTALGIGIILASVLTMAFADAVVKLVSADITLWQVFVVRSLVASPIIAALLLPAIGTARIKAIAWWWMERGDAVIRMWALSAIAFGALIAYAGGFP